MEGQRDGVRIACSACGETNEADATYCKKCGKRMDGKTLCSACGTANEADATFCKRCGKRLQETATSTRSATSVKPTASAQTASTQTASAAKPVKVCPTCDKVNSATATFCLRCGCSLTGVSAQGETTSQNASTATEQAQATAAKPQAGRAAGGYYGMPKHVLSMVLAVFTLVFVFLIRINGTFLYELFGDVYEGLVDETAVRAPFVLGAIVYAVSMAAVCITLILAVVSDILYFMGRKYVPDWINKAWAANSFLIYACGISLLHTVLNGSSALVTLDGTNLAGLLIGGVLFVIYTFVYLQGSTYLFDEQLWRVLSLCLLGALWVLAVVPQFTLKTTAEGITTSLGEGYMPLLLASFLLDAKMSTGVFIAGQVFQILFVFAVCGMIWLCLFDEEPRMRHVVQSISIAVFALLHCICALAVRGKYIDLVTPKQTTGNYWGSVSGSVSDSAAADVSLPAAIPIVLLLLSLAYVVVTCIRRKLAR